MPECLLCERFFTPQQIENGKPIQSWLRPNKHQVQIDFIVHEFSAEHKTSSERRIDELIKAGAIVQKPVQEETT